MDTKPGSGIESAKFLEDGGTTTPISFYLEEGEHTLYIKQREIGTKLDKLLITNDLNYIPTDTRPPDSTVLAPMAEEISSLLMEPLQANAGNDQISFSPVRLEGEATGGDESYLYTWFVLSGPDKKPNQFSSTTIPNPIFSPNETGTYTLYFTVNDEYNAPVSDTVQITLKSIPAMMTVELAGQSSEVLWLDAESGTIQSPMTVESSEKADSGQFIWFPNEKELEENGFAKYTFLVQKPGDYTIWGREISNWGNSNSFYIAMDDSIDIVWNTTLGGYETWIWDQVTTVSENGIQTVPAIFHLNAGQHTLYVKQREPGVKLDTILITDNQTYNPGVKITQETESIPTPAQEPTLALKETATPTATPTPTISKESLFTPTPRLPQTSQWDFNQNLYPSVGANKLIADAADPAVEPFYRFLNLSINLERGDAVRISKGTYFHLIHDFQPNGGGGRVNQYTLILDIALDSQLTGLIGLWQTNPENTDDADWFIDPEHGIGVGTNFGGWIVDREWYRLALAVDASAGLLESYINGELVQSLSGISLDGHWSIGPEALLMADDNGQNASAFIGSAQLRDITLTPSELAALGYASAEGIPQ